MTKRRTSIYLDEADKAAIQTIKERYGITSDSDAIRFAVRQVAAAKKGGEKREKSV